MAAMQSTNCHIYIYNFLCLENTMAVRIRNELLDLCWFTELFGEKMRHWCASVAILVAEACIVGVMRLANAKKKSEIGCIFGYIWGKGTNSRSHVRLLPYENRGPNGFDPFWVLICWISFGCWTRMNVHHVLYITQGVIYMYNTMCFSVVSGKCVLLFT